jgi:transforming growth factor-beta-induced protein
VLTSKWSSDDIKMVKSTGTALGPKLAFGEKDGALTVNGATVVKADIDCANGMVHAIDAVLMPPQ